MEEEPDIFEMDMESDEECDVFYMDEGSDEEEPSVFQMDNKKRKRPGMSMEEYNQIIWERLKSKSKSTLHAKFEKPCLIWQGYTDKNKYGIMTYNGKQQYVHRISLMIKLKVNALQTHNEHGERLEGRHLCNNTTCVEPSHLLLGTSSENGKDKAENGSCKGSSHPRATITEKDAQKIKASKYETGHPDYKTQKQRAIMFNVTKSVVASIDNCTRWTCAFGLENPKRHNYKRAKKGIPWTEEQWKKAKDKLDDSNYFTLSEEITYAGTHCKLWKQVYQNTGYGRLYVNSAEPFAHVIACTIANNYVRPEDVQVLHKCGNHSCVEYSHLKFGTPTENMMDKVDHGTNGRKLSNEDVINIRRLHATEKTSFYDLARMYHVTEAHVRNIINKKARKNG